MTDQPRPITFDPAVLTARAKVAAPHMHNDADLLDACDVLIARGDWMDVSRATELREVIAMDQVAVSAGGSDDQSDEIGQPVAAALIVVAVVIAIGCAIGGAVALALRFF